MARNRFHGQFGRIQGNRCPRSDSPVVVEVVDIEKGSIETYFTSAEQAVGLARGEPPRGKWREAEPAAFDRSW